MPLSLVSFRSAFPSRAIAARATVTAKLAAALAALVVVLGALASSPAVAQEAHEGGHGEDQQHAAQGGGHGDASHDGDSHGGDGGHGEENTGDPEAVSHSADGNYLNFEPLGIIELPRLFLTSGGGGGLGFDVYGSTKSALESGEYTLSNPNDGGAPFTQGQLQQAMDSHHHDYLYFPVAKKAGAGSVLIDFSITRHLVAVFLSALLLLALALGVASKYKRGIGRSEAPRGTWQNMVEVMILFMRDEVTRPAIGRRHASKYLPYVLSAFFFILIGNLLGLVPWGITATSNIMVTGTLALFTFFVTQLSGTKEYWAHTLNPPGVPWYVKIFLVPAEVIGLFTKPLALAFRLFGNMLSGHLVIVSMLGLIFIFTAQLGTGVGVGTILLSVPLTVAFYMLKIAVSFIQAYIFAMLSALFIGLAIEEHEHETPDGDHVPKKPAHENIDDFMDRSEHFGPRNERMISGDGDTQPAGQSALAQPAG